MGVYPKEIADLTRNPKFFGSVEDPNGIGTDVRVDCGCFITFEMRITDEPQLVEEFRYRTNGCGYMAAAAEAIAGSLKGRSLKDLNGIFDPIVSPPEGRGKCSKTVVEALKAALADHRVRVVEEFRGERALICTCFGVTEDAVERYVKENHPKSVEQMIDKLRAGSGCGSCRMLLQEVLDSS